MKWVDVLRDKSLQDLPYKLELNDRGQIVMSPTSNRRGMLQAKMGTLLDKLVKKGQVITECSIDTPEGVKVADVVWASASFIKEHEYQTPYPQSPEICVEISSPSNSEQEVRDKITLYLAKGAQEVWVCDEEGRVAFYNHSGEIKKSKLAARFPAKLQPGLP